MNQLETTLDVIKDRSGDAMDVVARGVDVVSQGVSHGVEVLGTKLGVIEPPPARRVRPWMIVGIVAVIVGVVVWRLRRRVAVPEADHEERVPPAKPLRKTA
jgi:hypothetical protein